MGTFVAIQKRGTIALPADLRARLGLDQPGMQLEITERNGEIVLKPFGAVPADQLWFWTPEWQAKEREADEDIAARNETEFRDVDEFVDYLNTMIDE